MSDLFDCSKTWDVLTPDQQREIGVAGLVLGLAALGEHAEPDGRDLGLIVAISEAERVLMQAASECCTPTLDIIPRPALAAIGVRACDGCGCTDAIGCLDGCHWVGERLCSNCVVPPQAAR